MGIRITLWKRCWKGNIREDRKILLRPLDRFTNEYLVSQILVSCINTVHMSVVIYDAFRFLLCHTRSSARCFNYFSCMECWNRILYKGFSFVPAALLSLKWRYLCIIWNVFLDIFCGNIGDWKIQMKHQLDATLCRFYFCRVTLHVSGASAHHREYLKLVQRQLVHVLSLQVSHHISLLGPSGPNKQLWWLLMQHCAGFISAESLYMFRAQAPIIRSI